jgi:hypothetical protein
MVHQAVAPGRSNDIQNTLDRHEVWDPDGTLRTTYLRRHRLRFWTRTQLIAALQDCGYADVHTDGPDSAFLAFAHPS